MRELSFRVSAAPDYASKAVGTRSVSAEVVKCGGGRVALFTSETEFVGNSDDVKKMLFL